MGSMSSKVEISPRTIVFTVFFLLLLYALFQIRQILTLFFISLVFMSALNPTVVRLEKLKIPRVVAILLIYLAIFLFFGLVLAGLVPPLYEQTLTLIDRFPLYLENLGFAGVDQGFLSAQLGQLGSIPQGIFKVTVGIFNNILAIFILAVITFYLLIERKNLDNYLHFLFGNNGEEKAKKFVDDLEKKLGGWVRVQASLMAIIALMSYLGLRLLGIDFALPLALLAGLLEIVPNVGPTIASIPAVLAGLAISPLMGVAVGSLYFLIQQIENSFIVPQVMAKGVGVNPLLAIVSLAAGFELGGVMGVILAIPLVLLAQVIYSEILSSKHFSSPFK